MTAKVVTVTQAKGGVGKTTLAAALAAFWGDLNGRKVLLIDLDPQANLSAQFLQMERGPDIQGNRRPPPHPEFDRASDPDVFERFSSADIFTTGELAAYATAFDNIDIVPAFPARLDPLEGSCTQSDVEARIIGFLRQWVEQVVEDDYDLVIVDTGPDLKPLTLSAVRAADHLVIPVEPERKCLDGLDRMFTTWREQAAARGGEIAIAAIVLNLYSSAIKLHRQYAQEFLGNAALKEFVAPTVMRSLSHWKYVDAEGGPPHVFALPGSSNARKDAERVCQFINEKVFTQ